MQCSCVLRASQCDRARAVQLPDPKGKKKWPEYKFKRDGTHYPAPHWWW